MLSNIFLAITIFFVIYILLNYKSKPYLIFFLIFIPSSNFFGFLPYGFFNQEGVIQQADIIFFIVIIIYFLTHKKKIKQNKFEKDYEKAITLFIILIILIFIFSILYFGNFLSTLKVFRVFIRYLSILLFFRLLNSLGINEIKNLLKFIDAITICLAVLYILNYGFNIPIFAIESYKEESYYGTILFRNFLAFPQFGLLIISRMMLSSTFGIKNILSILIIFVAVFLMYTRSALIAAFVILLGSLVFRLKLYPTSANIKKILLGMLLFITVAFILINYIFENQFYYFKSRTDEIVKAGSIVEVQNFDLRTQIIFSRIEKVLTVNPFFGLGFIREDVSQYYYPDLFIRGHDKTGQIIIGDQSYGNFIASLGLGGFALFLYLVFLPIYYKVKYKIYFNNLEISSLFWSSSIFALITILLVAYFSTNLTDDIIFNSFLLALMASLFNKYFNMTKYEKQFSINNNTDL